MTRHPRVLLVGPSGVAQSLAALFASTGCEPLVAGDFARARTLLDERPDVLVTELKLGNYNGLHLAIRASTAQTPAIVIGDADPVLEAEATRQHAKYVTSPADPKEVVALAMELLHNVSRTRRSIRKRVPPVDAVVNNEVRCYVCDVSYEGLRIEADEHDAPPPYFDLRLPQYDFACRVQRIWTSPAADNEAHLSCGAELAGSDEKTVTEWRALVDRLPGFAIH